MAGKSKGTDRSIEDMAQEIIRERRRLGVPDYVPFPAMPCSFCGVKAAYLPLAICLPCYRKAREWAKCCGDPDCTYGESGLLKVYEDGSITGEDMDPKLMTAMKAARNATRRAGFLLVLHHGGEDG